MYAIFADELLETGVVSVEASELVWVSPEGVRYLLSPVLFRLDEEDSE